MPDPDETDIIEDLIELRRSISRAESDLRAARLSWTFFKVCVVLAPVALVTMILITALLWESVNLGPYWGITAIIVIASAITLITLGIKAEGTTLLKPREREIDLEALLTEQALYFSGAQLELDVRQYSYRGAMLRNITSTRKRGDRYRRVNNLFQSVIIAGSLATTTVASLNPETGPLKWTAVALSSAVGLAAGFTGYFKYRERAFYLRQTADDLEEQINAYDLGLPPYNAATEEERIATLTLSLEVIRVAQQRREQQLDQPKGNKDEA